MGAIEVVNPSLIPGMDVKDGIITAIKPIGPPLLHNDTRIDLTILASAATSSILLVLQNLSGEEEDETYFHPASSPI
ncbi:hypothetical protein Lal_00034106 [Lupinus albus]|nr:hypothetical protein Lal_00034106 [Lupinus albus]